MSLSGAYLSSPSSITRLNRPEDFGPIIKGLLFLFGLASSCATTSVSTPVRSPPKPSATCEAPKIGHYNGLFCCREVMELKEPADAHEAAQIVSNEILTSDRPIRVVGAVHTANELICTSGLLIRTRRMKQVLGVEELGGEPTVVAEAGVTIAELNKWLHERGYTLGLGTLEFRDATIAGAVATAAHGSSLAGSSVLSSQVRGLWIVTPRDVQTQGARYADPTETTAKTVSPLTWRALRANLGALGLVTKVRLAIEKDFNLRVRVTYAEDHVLWRNGGVTDLMKDCMWGQVNWFPRAGGIVQSCGTRAQVPVDAHAENSLLDPIVSPSQIWAFKRLLDTMAFSDDRICPERMRYLNFKVTPPQQKGGANDGGKVGTSNDVVGAAWSMMSSALTPVQTDVPQSDFEIALPMANAQDMLLRLKDILLARRGCLPLVGVFLRFTRADESTLVGHAVTDGASFPPRGGVVYVELVTYRPFGHTLSAADTYAAPYWKTVEDLIDRGGRPHWAKNHLRLFQRASARDPALADRIRQFREVANHLDPKHRFANEFTNAVGLTASPSAEPAQTDQSAGPAPDRTAPPSTQQQLAPDLERAERRSGSMQYVTVSQLIDAPIARVWERYTDYVSWTRWSHLGHVRLERQGSPDPHGAGCVRVISNLGIKVWEEILSFDPPHHLTYQVTRGGLPMTDHLGEVLLEPQGDRTLLTWRCRFRASWLMGPLYRELIALLFRHALQGLARDLQRA